MDTLFAVSLGDKKYKSRLQYISSQQFHRPLIWFYVGRSLDFDSL